MEGMEKMTQTGREEEWDVMWWEGIGSEERDGLERNGKFSRN